MSTPITPSAVLVALLDHARQQGAYEVARVGEFRKPTKGLAFCVFMTSYGSANTGSGLADTAGLLHATARVQMPMLYQPEETLEGLVLDAADGYLSRLNGAFTLGGLVRNVDLLAEQGVPMVWEFGYIVIDQVAFRIADLPIRVVLNDQWTQAE